MFQKHKHKNANKKTRHNFPQQVGKVAPGVVEMPEMRASAKFLLKSL